MGQEKGSNAIIENGFKRRYIVEETRLILEIEHEFGISRGLAPASSCFRGGSHGEADEIMCISCPIIIPKFQSNGRIVGQREV